MKKTFASDPTKRNEYQFSEINNPKITSAIEN
jgi:hypothetical protein